MHSFKYIKIYSRSKFNNFPKLFIQCYSCGSSQQSGLVIGVYDSPDGSGQQEFTDAGDRLNESTSGFLRDLLNKQYIPFAKAAVFSGLGIGGANHLALASLGPKKPKKLNLIEQLNEEKEFIRQGIAAGARGVQDAGAMKISVDGATVPESAAEGAILGTFKYKANLTSGDKSNPVISLYDHPDANSFASGEINAEAQNWARYLSHAPPNLKKPRALAQEIIEKLCKFDIRIDLRNKEWMAVRKMATTLSLIKGMCEAPILVELGYCGDCPEVKPIVLVGKGNVFDSGGLFLKPYKGIHNFRADMAGAAAIVGTMMAIARKRLPINVRATILLYENMPTPMGLKPGDVVKDKSGTCVRISDPDNDCRVVLADVVNMTNYYAPQLIIDVGTFTRSVAHAFGLAASGAFVSHAPVWNELMRAGLESGDRLWRLPLWKYFALLNASRSDVDMDNGTSPMGGDTCQAAAFLKKFVPRDLTDCCCPKKIPFVHIDMYNTGLLSQTDEEIEPYYRKGIKMGRPTRALIQFLYHRACLLPKKNEAGKK